MSNQPESVRGVRSLRGNAATARASAFALLLALAGCGAAGSGETIVRVEPDAPLDSDDATTPLEAGSLQRALAGVTGPARVVLEAGRYHLSPSAHTDPTCGNCLDPDESVPATVGLRISGTGIEIVGVGRDSVVVHTHAGYGLLFEGCQDCVLRGVTVTDGTRDVDERATSAAVVVRHSRVRFEDCSIRDNIGDPDVVRSTVVGVAGIAAREGAVIEVEGCRLERNSWDGIVLYRGARALIRDNIVDGIDAARGERVGGGRGVGIGLTWDAQATIEGNVVRNYWKGIGVFVDAQATVRHNVVEDILTWGIAYWAAGEGRPRAEIRENAIYGTGACGAMIAGPEEASDEGFGEFVANALVLTAGDARYDDGEPYCTQRPLARESVPAGFAIADNLFFDNRQPGPGPVEPQLERAEFAAAVQPLLEALGAYRSTGASAFVRDMRPR